MAFVYLITEENDNGNYKIGSTRKNINERLKELQTGNSNKLVISKYFECDKPFKLTDEEVNNFKNVCQKYYNIIESLKDNPFF